MGFGSGKGEKMRFGFGEKGRERSDCCSSGWGSSDAACAYAPHFCVLLLLFTSLSPVSISP